VSFRTTCPACASVFRLGADQLDAAQGWVQCSVCGAAFDAHPSLLMEDGSPLVTEVEAETEAEPAAATQASAFPFTKHNPDEVRAIEQAALEVAIPSASASAKARLNCPRSSSSTPIFPYRTTSGRCRKSSRSRRHSQRRFSPQRSRPPHVSNMPRRSPASRLCRYPRRAASNPGYGAE